MQHDKQIAFVRRMVKIFTDRHHNKLEDVTEALDEKSVIRTSGLENINRAMDVVEQTHGAIQKAVDAHEMAMKDFDAQYDDRLQEIMHAAQCDREDFMEEKRADFEYKINTAVGLIELVSSEKAFEVLEACRLEIENM